MRSFALPNEDKLVAEARRQLLNHVEGIYEPDRQGREALLSFQREQQLFGLMWLQFCSAARSSLVLGQARFVLDHDSASALAVFAGLKDWLPFFDASIEGALRGGKTEFGDALRYEAPQLTDALVCLLLANDRATLQHVAGLDERRVLTLPEKVSAGAKSWVSFALNFLYAVRGDYSRMEIAPEQVFSSRDTRIHIRGYDRLLRAIAAKDTDQFNAHCIRTAEEFRKRVSAREGALNEHGYGRVAQLATFDALGTALCRLAHWRGMSVHADPVLYPVEFWS
jgi:hypothetical protein